MYQTRIVLARAREDVSDEGCILIAEMDRTRDPAGFDAPVAACRKDPANTTKDGALRRIATIMAAKVDTVRDITAGDCVEIVELLREVDLVGRPAGA